MDCDGRGGWARELLWLFDRVVGKGGGLWLWLWMWMGSVERLRGWVIDGLMGSGDRWGS